VHAPFWSCVHSVLSRLPTLRDHTSLVDPTSSVIPLFNVTCRLRRLLAVTELKEAARTVPSHCVVKIAPAVRAKRSLAADDARLWRSRSGARRSEGLPIGGCHGHLDRALGRARSAVWSTVDRTTMGSGLETVEPHDIIPQDRHREDCACASLAQLYVDRRRVKSLSLQQSSH